MTPNEDEYFDIIGFHMEKVVSNNLENTMLFAEEDESFYDAKIFDHIAYLGAIRLIPRLSCIMKLKLYQVDVKITFLNRYLNQDASNYATKKELCH